MSEKEIVDEHYAPLQIIDCEWVPVPPGTKSCGRLPRGGEPEHPPSRIGWVIGGVAVAALIVGVLIGRFLLS